MLRSSNTNSVHPRSRGEHDHLLTDERHLTGSSPLARGTHGPVWWTVHVGRFIPARAGNTARPRSRSSFRPVHPRSRGEHMSIESTSRVDPGSSPLARGTRVDGMERVLLLRFIPARAGNTHPGSTTPNSSAVHPRSRGEHSSRNAASMPLNGSSPLARGTQTGRERARSFIRFIPARAGNTGRARRTLPGDAVHPRSRGEHHSTSVRRGITCGSSPLARGTLSGNRRPMRHGRFIPARAGNTSTRCASATPAAVHPRSRGEHVEKIEYWTAEPGSSPLARGTPGNVGALTLQVRFIPARAGNTGGRFGATIQFAVHPRSRGEHPTAETRRARRQRFIPARAGNTGRVWAVRPHRPVHPRSRGEHTFQYWRSKQSHGSSPLARGTQFLGEIGNPGMRFIPARAGNTTDDAEFGSIFSVHPRSRGEHPGPPAAGAQGCGSSPLARGTPFGGTRSFA